MYFIVNKTKSELQISDIKISLGPRQAMDLDKAIDRRKSDRSKDLDLAIKKGVIQVKQKTPTDTPIVISSEENSNDKNIDSIKKDLSEEIKNQFEALKSQLVNNNSNNNDFSQIINQLQDVLNEKSNFRYKSEDEDDTINNEQLLDIHARSIDKKLKDIKSNKVKYDRQEVNDDLGDNISELEGLL